MTKKGAALKAVLMGEAEEIIEELVVWYEETEEPSFTQIEEKVLELRQRLSERMAGEVAERQPINQAGPGPKCGKCGREMRSKGAHRKEVVSWTGEVELKRRYYYCPECREGLFPPG